MIFQRRINGESQEAASTSRTKLRHATIVIGPEPVSVSVGGGASVTWPANITVELERVNLQQLTFDVPSGGFVLIVGT